MNLNGKKVKIFLKNGLTVEGIVQEHSQESLVLRSPNSKNILVIYQPSENLIMAHILLEESGQTETDQVPKEPDPEELELDHYEPDPSLRLQKLAHLRKLQVDQHRKDVSKHLTTWKVGVPKLSQDYYEQPNVTQLSSIYRAAKKGS